jgi:hypothetical protein
MKRMYWLLVLILSLIVVISDFMWFEEYDEDFNKEIPMEPDADDEKAVYGSYNPEELGIDPRKIRGGEGDYLSLITEIGHGLNIGYQNSITSADVDNDGIIEILFANEDGYIHIIQYLDGDYVDEWRSPNLDWEPYGLAVGDTDSDGTPEIVVGNHYGTIYIFGYQGPGIGYVKEWEYQLNKEEPYGIAVGDLDNDGYQEIVIGALQLVSTEENVFVFGYDGTTYVEEYRYLMTDFLNYAHAVVIFDVDSDGTDEFVVGTMEFKMSTQTPRGTFYVFGHNGNDYVVEYKRPDISDWVGDLDCGDVDDDGEPEIVVSGASVNIYQFESGVYFIENNIPEEHPKLQVGDVNGDGQIEIITGYWELKVWQEETLLWESETFEQEIYAIAIVDSDSDQKNEILFTKGVMDWYSDLYVMGHDGSTFIEEWVSDYLPSISSISINDVNSDGENDLILATRPGELLIFENPKNNLQVRDALRIDIGFEIIHVFCDNFDGDSTNDIVATDAHNMVYFLEHNGADYVSVDQINVDDNIVAADIGDVDEDGKMELVLAIISGNVYVIGFDGSYEVEWEALISEDGITAITTGDSDNDNQIEILVGGFDYVLYVLVYDGSEYVETRSQLMSGMIFTLGVGDTDFDGNNELVVEVGYFDLVVFHWNGTYYVMDWNMPFSEDAHNEAMDINHIDSTDRDLIAFGTFKLYVIGHNTDYEILFESETYPTQIQCLFMGDLDESGTNEVLVSIGSYIFIFGKDQWAIASLSASKTTVEIGDEITFDGSNSKGAGALEYYYDFGDGIDSGWISDSIATHSYYAKGIYTASLTIRDENGKESTNPSEVTITVVEPNVSPIAYIDEITPSSSIYRETVAFSGHGTDEDGTIVAYMWESNRDGHLSDDDSFTISSLSEGTHTIFFKVKDNTDTWSEAVSETIKINPEPQNQKPVAVIDSISPNPGTQGDTITFIGHGTDEDGMIASYSWESDIEGELSDLSSFSITSLTIGTHEISFKVKDDNETWSGFDFVTLTINTEPPNQAPLAHINSISPNPALEGEIVTFSGYGVDEDGMIVSYSWESDINGLLSSHSSFNKSSLSVGEHVITFKVKDDEDIWSEPVTVSLEIKEREEEEEKRAIPILLGAFSLFFISIIVWAVAKRKERKRGLVNTFVSCPGCGSSLRITISAKPQTIKCPICGIRGLVNK